MTGRAGQSGHRGLMVQLLLALFYELHFVSPVKLVCDQTDSHTMITLLKMIPETRNAFENLIMQKAVKNSNAAELAPPVDCVSFA